ncbi:MAG: hypothetical protein IJH91_02615 [Mogibacterium sp.]|nr:hypothetical protein [Mogibacterium sp.]
MKKKLALLVTVFCALALALSGCGSSTPLAKAAKALEKSAEEGHYDVAYIGETDSLIITFHRETDKDLLFETLNKEIEGQDVGNLFFIVPEEEDISVIYTVPLFLELGKLQCSSIQILGLNSGFVENTSWSSIIDKANLVYLPSLPNIGEGTAESRPKLATLKRVWIGDGDLSNVSQYTDLEEIGIYADLMPKIAAEDADGDADESGEAQSFLFEGGAVYKTLVDGSNVKRLLIAPTSPSYTLDDNGSKFIFTLQNQYPGLLVNPPDTALEIDPVASVDDSSLVPVIDLELPNLKPDSRKSVLKTFLNGEAEDVYNRAIKFKVKNETPVVHGKALVCVVDPRTVLQETWNEDDYWPTEPQWPDYYPLDVVVFEDAIGGDIQTPDMAGDYESMVYVYPVYVLYGSYGSGTKAYTMTYQSQVFDLTNEIAYAPVTFARGNPPQTIYYGGQPQLKASGAVETKEVCDYLRTLKTE